MANVREMTDTLIGMVEDGELGAKHALLCCMSYMSEDEVADMMRVNELIEEDEEEEEEEDDAKNN